ncbi:MAG: propanediol utilization protein [Candidatus Nomurabacteria bacterium]|nr:MAG: propanediol utilization protein [Candidatus Nomurabacteria bacterium]
MEGFTVPVEVSARHLHVTEETFHILFGAEANLSIEKNISQPNQFIAKERVKVIGPKGSFSSVGIVGPYRAYTQLELAKSDARHIGVDAALTVSGTEVENTVPVTLEGPLGSVTIHKDVIIAARHLHCDPATAAKYGLKHLDKVKARITGPRGLAFDQVVVRAREGKDALALHLDTDEGNAAGVEPGTTAELILEDISDVPQPELTLD